MPGKSDDAHEIGDVVDKRSGSAQEEYFRYMLLKEKLGSRDEAKKILGARSELDEIELKIMANLADITESSPEFAQIVDLTGSRDRFEQARRLAESVHDKMRAEQVMALYTPNKAGLQEKFLERSFKTIKFRSDAIDNMAARAAVKRSMAAKLADGAGAGRTTT